jgi:metallo-beta-lactamase family protein
MACDASEVYHQHREDHDLSEHDLDPAHPVLAGPRVTLCRTVEESKALNHISGPAIIISSSGMMTGGRILHHLRQRLPSSRNTVVLGGFQALGTRGRSLADGARWLRMHGQDVPVRAAIESVPGLSGHADRSGLLRWMADMPAPKRAALVHGEPEPADALAETLRNERGWTVDTPAIGDVLELG